MLPLCSSPRERLSMRRPTLAPAMAVVLGVALLLLVGYMLVYYLALTGIRSGSGRTLLPIYKHHCKVVEYCFWPAHQADRIIRPRVWISRRSR
jgi:hypothetical protein